MRIITAVAIAVLTVGSTVRAHDIPNDVTVQTFLRPEGHRLRFLVRVPLQAMRDVDIPTRGPGYLDLTRADAALRHAATIWIAQNTQLFEEDSPLDAPRLAAVRVSLPSDPSFGDYDRALAHVTGQPSIRRRTSTGRRGCSMPSSSIRLSRRRRGSRFALRFGGSDCGLRTVFGS